MGGDRLHETLNIPGAVFSILFNGTWILNTIFQVQGGGEDSQHSMMALQKLLKIFLLNSYTCMCK